MSLRATPIEIQELLAKRLYIAKLEAFGWPAQTVGAAMHIYLRGTPTKGGSNSRYLVNVYFDTMPDKDSRLLYFSAYLVNEGGNFIRWSMQEASNFLERSVLHYPTLQVGVTVGSAGAMARVWGEKRRGSLSARFNKTSFANMTAKALILENKRTAIAQKNPVRAELYRVAAENLREAAYFGDLVRGNTNDINNANQVSDPV
jgi:hypothetical protein